MSTIKRFKLFLLMCVAALLISACDRTASVEPHTEVERTITIIGNSAFRSTVSSIFIIDGVPDYQESIVQDYCADSPLLTKGSKFVATFYIEPASQQMIIPKNMCVIISRTKLSIPKSQS